MTRRQSRFLSLLLSHLALGIIAGFTIGICWAIYSVSANRHFQHGMHNLIAFAFQHSLNATMRVVGAMIIPLSICSALYQVWGEGNQRTHSSFVAATLITSIYYFYGGWLLNHYWLPELFSLKSLAGNAVIAVAAILLWMRLARIRLESMNPRWPRLAATTLLGSLLLLNGYIYGHKSLDPPEGPNVVLVTIDTLRADHLGRYGYSRNTSPHIDKLAQKALVFTRAFAQAPWTLPSMASLHTSLYPSEHGATKFNRSLDQKFITLAEYLRNDLYTTIAVVSHTLVSEDYGFSQGFDHFDQEYMFGHDGISSALITQRAGKYLEEQGGRRFFLWVHYFDPHYNYMAHEDYQFYPSYRGNLLPGEDIATLRNRRRSLAQGDIDYLLALYDGEIAFTDRYVGHLLQLLDELELEKETIIILTADHGEEFMEREWLGHTNSLYGEQIHVPLIVYDPRDPMEQRQVGENVEVKSVFDKVLEYCRIDRVASSGFKGKAGVALSEVDFAAPGDRNAHKRAIVQGDYKMIHDLESNSYELYNLRLDPHEQSNIYGEEVTLSSELRSFLDIFDEFAGSNAQGRGTEVELSEKELDRLRSLGYVE